MCFSLRVLHELLIKQQKKEEKKIEAAANAGCKCAIA